MSARFWANTWRVVGLLIVVTAVGMVFAGFPFIQVWLMLGLAVVAAWRFMHWWNLWVSDGGSET